MEGCTPVKDTTVPPAPTDTTAETTSAAISSTSSDISLAATLKSSCTISNDTPLATPGADQDSSPLAPVVVAVPAAPSCGCSPTAAIPAIAAAPTYTMTTVGESNTIHATSTTTSTSNISRRKKRKVVRIDVYSDTTCPWCYITKKRLEKAINAFQLASSSSPSSSSAVLDTVIKESAKSVVFAGCSSTPAQQQQQQQQGEGLQHSSTTTTPADQSSSRPPQQDQQHQNQQTQEEEEEKEEIHFDIHWRPFQLDPQAPRIPIRKTQLYHRKFGTEQTVKIQDRIVNAGKVEGIQFLYTDQSLYNNTIDSHRMIRFARERLGRLPVASSEGEGEVVVAGEEGVELRKMVDSGNSNGTPHDQNPQDYFPIYNPTTTTPSEEHDDDDDNQDDDVDDEDEEVDELGARMEDAMVDELFRSHFERGECSEFETLKACARSVLIQTAAFSAAAAAALDSSYPSPSRSIQPPHSTHSASSLQGHHHQTSSRRADTHADTNTNNTNQRPPSSSPSQEEYTSLVQAKEQELIDQQLQELDEYLHSDEGLDEVMEEIRVAKEDLGMQGVPMIVIQNEYLLSAQFHSIPEVLVIVRQREVSKLIKPMITATTAHITPQLLLMLLPLPDPALTLPSVHPVPLALH
ncbi:hypothetical protein BGZ95_011330 [Linnemannia exigua]|uniref:Thioredoxin-like protein n=1 Tax=Linnemannia exigua TaxID=604196 RepID=A0AAD4H5C3_9FUNG|nr:hypothetical protein BGZ95_011330 [Linnemannia exigua]